MGNEEIFQKIKQLIETTEIWDIINVNTETSISDTNYGCEIVRSCEKLFNVDLTDMNMEESHTVGELVDLVEMKLFINSSHSNDDIFQIIKDFMLSCDSWDYIGTDVTRDTSIDGDTEYGCEVCEWTIGKFDLDIETNTENIHTLGELVELVGIKLADKPFKL